VAGKPSPRPKAQANPALWVPVRKVRTADACYAVINDAWQAAPDIARLVVAVCSCQTGIGADGLVRIRHHGRGRFDLEAFDAGGGPVRPPASAFACCAIAIRDEYGYQCAQLRERGAICAVEVTADQVKLRPQDGLPATRRAWLVTKGDFAVTGRAAAAMSWQSPVPQIRPWAGGEQWLPLSRAC
jgi:hypothetical protein